MTNFDSRFSLPGRPKRRKLFLEQLEARQLLTDLVVNSNADLGLGQVSAGVVTLRSAIESINAAQDSENSITFNLTGNARTIEPHTGLPAIAFPVVIDGNPSNNPALSPIEISGAFVRAHNIPANGLSLDPGSNESVLRHLAINRFTAAGISIDRSDNNTIAQNYLGLDPSGKVDDPADPPGNVFGIYITTGSGNLVGGSDATQANVISGNLKHGIWLKEQTNPGTTIQFNKIGVDVTGLGLAGNGEYGVFVDASNNNVIRDNIIGANKKNGVEIEFPGGGSNQVTNNWIGTDPQLTANLGNLGDGIRIAAGGIDNTLESNNISHNHGAGIEVVGDGEGISRENRLTDNQIFDNEGDGVFLNGGTDIHVEENTIESNGRNGVTIVQFVRDDIPSGQNRLTRNQISGNVGLGIDLVKPGDPIPQVTPNDDLDADDSGGNFLQNAPELTSVTDGSGNTTLTGQLRVSGDAVYHLEFFLNDAADSSQHGEGQFFAGEQDVQASNGQTVIDFSIPVALSAGQYVTATATDANGNTSEFSNAVGLAPPLVGTAGDDLLTVRVGSPYQVELNGFLYEFPDESFEFEFDTAGGNDTVWLYGGAGTDTALLRPGVTTLTGPNYHIQISNAEIVNVDSKGGENENASFYDSSGNDAFTGKVADARLKGTGFDNYVKGFDKVYAYATAGGASDFAYLYDSPGDDTFIGSPTESKMTGPGFFTYAKKFDKVFAYATAGGAIDVANLYDSTGDDKFYGRPTESEMSGTGFYYNARKFEKVYAYANAGGANDNAFLYDSAGDDKFDGKPTESWMEGVGFYYNARKFDKVYAYATAGGANDIASLYDSAGDDKFYGKPTESWMEGSGFYNYARKFDKVYAYATGGGNDSAYLYGSDGDDTFKAYAAQSEMSGTGFYYYAKKFENVYGYAKAGAYDVAYLRDIAAADTLLGRNNYAHRSRVARHDWAYGFDKVNAYSAAGETAHADVRDVDYLFQTFGSWL